MKNVLFLLFSFLIVSCTIAQPGSWSTKSKKAIKYIEEARNATYILLKETGLPDYGTAIEWCDKAIEKDPEFTEAYEIKADYCVRAGRIPEAIESYKTAINTANFYSGTGYVFFDLAVLEMSQGLYEDAMANLKKYRTFKNANEDYLKQTEWMIANCEFGIEAMKNPLPFKPVNVGAGVNTFEAEYFPTLTVDQKQLLFTRRTSQYEGSQEDFFVSTSVQDYWEKGEPMPKNINTPFNEGAPTFAPDGRTLIFVGCAVEGYGYGPGRRGYGSCDLFVTEKVGDKWLDPINLPGAVNSRHWETQPSLSSDGKTLYFIRGNLRSSGGRAMRNGDIYVSKKQADGSWGEAVKLPNNINTPYSESSVHIHPDGKTLYFSSNGHVGMGGFDLYMTTLQPDGSWSDPKNLGYPINTASDENSLIVYANGEYALFGSSREGGLGLLDLYEFKMPESIRPTKTIYMTGTVFDINTKARLEAEFSLVDLETGKEVVSSTSDKVNGTFLVTLPINREYGLLVKKDGYNTYSVNFNLTVPENSDEPYHQDVPLVPLNEVGVENILANVLFDLDSDKLRPESYVELDEFASFLLKHQNLKIELQGHTDSQGDDDHNLDLSKRRAKSVYEYLVGKGVPADRMTHEGFGETKPSQFINDAGETIVRDDAYINSLSTEKEKKSAHQQNRRTVYVIKSS
ncbi:MAG: OmpA family protein [Flavobacteriales bacterium]|nr:OmpA family protein [Flavobacteriales bacterium]